MIHMHICTFLNVLFCSTQICYLFQGFILIYRIKFSQLERRKYRSLDVVSCSGSPSLRESLLVYGIWINDNWRQMQSFQSILVAAGQV